MGLSLGGLINTVFPGVGDVIGPSGGGQRTAAVGSILQIGATALGFPEAAPFIGAAVQNLEEGQTIPDTGPMPGNGTYGGYPVTQVGAFGSIVGLGARMSPIVAGAIAKLSRVLGGASGSIVSYGSKVWTALSSWAARNPGVNVITMLVGLGLTAEEAAHFIAWGATKKRRRRARGISARDLRTSRRTMRKILNMSRQMRELCGAAPFHAYHRRKRHA